MIIVNKLIEEIGIVSIATQGAIPGPYMELYKPGLYYIPVPVPTPPKPKEPKE